VWRRWVPLAGVVALLGAAMFAALYGNPGIPGVADTPVGTGTQRPFQPRDLPPDLPSPPPTPGPAQAIAPPWVGWLLSAVCLTAILVVVLALVLALLRERLALRPKASKRERSAPPTLAETQQRMRAAVDEGLADLDAGDADPRRAVIACWVRLEQAAAVAGTPREPGDTSTELVARLLESHMVSADVLAGFAAVYREARYATHTVDEAMRDEARSALRLLRDQLMVHQ
jgi:hypothetical protein